MPKIAISATMSTVPASPLRPIAMKTAAQMAPIAVPTRRPGLTRGLREWRRSWFSVGIEDLLHGGREVAGESERQRQRGGVALGLDRVDGLPRHADRLAEIGLGEAPLGSQLADGVLHGCQVSLSSIRCQVSLTRRAATRLAARLSSPG